MQKTALLVCVLAFISGTGESAQVEPVAAKPISIAVFNFEVEDATPAAAYVGKVSNDESVQKATVAAREQMASSALYHLVSVDSADASQVRERTLHNCDGCEAQIADKLGAQQSMLGIIGRATQTDYYITVVIRDASTGKTLDVQSANFAGGPEGWASGTRMLIKHQILGQ